MTLMSVTDSVFLAVETREHPMHVGGLELFTPPADAGPDYPRDLRAALLRHTDARPVFRRHPANPVSTRGYVAWAEDTELELDYHFRHSALPGPGRVRELLEVTSRWHSTPLDRHRPLWEIHLVEGLQDGRFAMYSKIHHALMDGVSALRQLRGVLSTDPDARDCPPPWGSPPSAEGRTGSPRRGFLHGLPVPDPRRLVRTGRATVGQLAGLAPMATRVATEAWREHRLTLPLRAPKTMLNVPIGGARRFAAESWERTRIAHVAHAARVSSNDIVLAMCSGALRTYLTEHGALPDEPLVAMVPVSLRGRTEAGATSGNRIGAILCDLGTHLADPTARLSRVARSMADGKRLFSDLTPIQALVLSAFNVAPLAATPLPGFVEHTRPPFNIVISNVPGPRERLYFNGARLDGIYPASVLLDGQALNITFTNGPTTLDCGITGCRRSVPHLQRLLGHLEQSLADLECAVA
ncbi:WS/DGAT/MGAT family O-acyltransferase [Saccharomonospora saliphila]|uniref:WS/DGAT/MGAT family O-acyltransferase n=1 Tax=Saccharomonospora saliphila TaxID=369829 RepID=UPI00048A95ED|nr:wax ester/triacylglycerol synthase family O-acyltransferase [Saccharomonospora saliphila]